MIHFFVNKVKVDSTFFFLYKAFPRHKNPFSYSEIILYYTFLLWYTCFID